VRRILFISALGPSYPFTARIDEAIRNALEESPYQIELYHEYMETILFPEPSKQQEFRESLLRKYRNRKPDLILAIGLSAIRLMSDSHAKFDLDTPIVFCGGNEAFADNLTLDSHFAGAWMVLLPAKTLDVALKLQPGTKHVVVVGGTGLMDRRSEGLVREQLHAYETRLEFTYLTDLEMPTLLQRLGRLPEDTIVLYTSFSQDAAGTHFIDATQSVPMVVAAANAPVFAMTDIFVGQGTVGGYVSSYVAQAQAAAGIAKRILNGEKPQDIPIVRGTNVYMFDWRALQRWRLSERALPPQSTVLFRQPTLWERDRNYILAGSAVIVVQLMLILGLLLQRSRKRKAEAVLRESEKRFRVMADTTPSLIWMCDQAGRITYLNDRRLVFTGGDPGAGYSDTWTAYVHPDDLPTLQDAVSRALKTHEPFSKEYRLRRSDGVYRWMFDVAAPRVNGDGSFAGFIGSAIDVTDQKLAQEALESVSGRLIEAQEKERSRIARDLHDDICQRLALLSMELEQANRNGAPPSTKRKLEEIRQHCSEITGDVQSLSHQLHSSKLEYLGIVAAIRSFCKEFAKQHDVSLDFRDENVPTHLPRDISLCLFRVAQEALHNAVKYSGTNRFSVGVRGVAGEIQLEVNDAGAGFDVEEAKGNRGLGLVSMQERVHLVHGRFAVESKPGAGTKIVAVVPVAAEDAGASKDAASDQPASVTGAA
jgi:PAS domain S-box-containing protein